MKTIATVIATALLSLGMLAAPADAAERTRTSACVSGWEWDHLRAAIREPGLQTLADVAEYLDGNGEQSAKDAHYFKVCRRASVHTRVVVTTKNGDQITGVMKVHPGKGFTLR